MRVDWKERIGGLTMIEVRDLARALYDERPLDFIGERTKLGKVKARQVANAMIARGWLKKLGPDSYRTTIAGNGLAMSRKLAPITRTAAETLLAKVIAEAEAINADKNMAYDVTRLSVFGSFLGDAKELSDLDIAFETRARWVGGPDQDTQFRECMERSIRAYPVPARGWSGVSALWPFQVVRRRLKVSNRVSLHDRSEVDALGWAQRVVYGDESGRAVEKISMVDR